MSAISQSQDLTQWSYFRLIKKAIYWLQITLGLPSMSFMRPNGSPRVLKESTEMWSTCWPFCLNSVV